MYDILQLNEMLVPELREIADSIGIHDTKKLSKQDLIYHILDQQAVASSKAEDKENSEAPRTVGRPSRMAVTAAKASGKREKENTAEDDDKTAARKKRTRKTTTETENAKETPRLTLNADYRRR